MLIEKKKISELKRAAYNPRVELKKGDKVYEQLKRSIDEFGMVQPIVWNRTTGNVVGGHQRLTVLEDSGVEDVDVVVVELDEASEKSLNLVLNKIKGEWDYAELANILEELRDTEFIKCTGFEKSEIDGLLGEARSEIEFEEESEEEEDSDTDADVKARIGEYVFTIPAAYFEDAMAKIHIKFGFEKRSVQMAFGKRVFGDEYTAD